MTPMEQAAAATRELFTSLVAAGFSEQQAGVIIGVYLAQLISGSQGEERRDG